MEKRIGTTTILNKAFDIVLSEHSSDLTACFHPAFHHSKISVISLSDLINSKVINALSREPERLNDVKIKSLISNYKEEHKHEQERTEQGIH